MSRHAGVSPMRHETPSEDELAFIRDHYGPRAPGGRLMCFAIATFLGWPYWRVHQIARAMGLCFQAHYRPDPDARLKPTVLPPTPQEQIANARAQIEREVRQ